MTNRYNLDRFALNNSVAIKIGLCHYHNARDASCRLLYAGNLIINQSGFLQSITRDRFKSDLVLRKTQ